MSEHILLICLTAFNWCEYAPIGYERYECANHAAEVCEEARDEFEFITLKHD